jgi:hypothetical protein
MRSERAKLPWVNVDADIGAPSVSLIAKWRKTGYEKLCCLRCIQTKVRVVQDGGPPMILGLIVGYCYRI